MKYIVICLSRCYGKSENFRVSDKKRIDTFATMKDALLALQEDMAEYLAYENEMGYKCNIVGNHIEWDDDDVEREAKWYVYGVEV